MSPTPPPSLDRRQSAVLARTPVAATRILYRGGAAQAFAAACWSRNPQVEVLADPSADARVAVLAADDLARVIGDPDLLGRTDLLVAALAGGEVRHLDALAAHGLEVLRLLPAETAHGYFDDTAADLTTTWRQGALPVEIAGGDLVVVARRQGGRVPMRLDLLTFAPTLMDIRTRLPAEALRSEPDLVVTHQKVPATVSPIVGDGPKILVLQRPAPMDPQVWRRAMLDYARAGWIVVLEYDDHPALVAQVKGRPVTEADWLRFAHVHAVQTSTVQLVELFKPHNPETRLFPNAVFDIQPFPEDLPRRVFYGAVSRGPFAAHMAASLGPVVAEHPDVVFEVIGDRAVFDALPTANKRFHDYMSFDAYLRLMATCAISLSPVEGSQHQETKSDAKFLDAAARGVLTIASPTIYAGVIRDGRNGLIAATLADWAPVLAGALRDAPARRRMTRDAWDYVAGARMFARQVPERHAWYRDLWDRRDALNAALAAR